MAIIFTLLAAVTASLSNLSPAENAMSNLEKKSSIHFGKKTASIQEILDQGEVVVLSDGTKWIVYPSDQKFVGGWLGPADVVITKSNTPKGKYAFAMKNMWTKKTVLVKRWPSGRVQ